MTRTLLGAAIAAASITFVACDGGPAATEDGGRITIGFSSAALDASSSAGALEPSSVAAADEDVVVAGDNGTLTITDIGFIVSEFKLERDEAPCEELEGEDEDVCEKFETGLAYVDVPLDGEIAPVVTEPVPAGTYIAMKFEVKNAGPEQAGGDDSAALLEAIEAAGYTDWPENASLVVTGSFTPAGGEPREFTAYFEAEIKVVMDFDPALVIDGEVGTVEIEIDPRAWFTDPDGRVTDLSAFDFATTGEVVEFEAKMEHGFSKIELDGFDD